MTAHHRSLSSVAALAMVAVLLAAGIVPAHAQTAPPTRRHALMPVPASVQWAEGALPLTADSRIAVTGHRDARLLDALGRFVTRLEARTTLEVKNRGWDTSETDGWLVVRVGAAGSNLPSVGEDESYRLQVDPRQARLEAATVVGALRGLETALQLVDREAGRWVLPAVRIEDNPRFPWRGLLVDVGRHWMPIEVLKRNLDGMAAVKLNVLHLHLTEDQGFRVESKRYPKLQQLGSDGLYFTQEQVREIVAYAAARGIRVVPEFDMPGHATSWFVGHPELASAPGPYAIERKWGIFDPTIDPTREEVYVFLDRFLGEMAALFPDPYMHIGGDENNGKQWAANAAIQAFMSKRRIADAHALQAYFNKRVNAILQKHGKRMVGWDEVLHPDLPKDIVVHSWRGQKSLAEATAQGYQGILSWGYYVDLMFPAALHYLVDPIPPAGDQIPAAARRYLTPTQIAYIERSNGVTFDAEASKRVLGGEACMWAEYVSPETVDTRIWPRLAAIAERLWSPRDVRDVEDMYRRLARVSIGLEDYGLLHRTATDRMLRRLAGQDEVSAIRLLADMVEPVKEYRRGRLRPATQMMPLTRMVDVARADSIEARVIAENVERLLRDAPRWEAGRSVLEQRFRAWYAASPEVVELAARAPALTEVQPLGERMSELGRLGLHLLALFGNPSATLAASTPDQQPGGATSWRDGTLATLTKAAEPVAEMELAVVAPLRRLACGAITPRELSASADAWLVDVDQCAAPPPAPRPAQ